MILATIAALSLVLAVIFFAARLLRPGALLSRSRDPETEIRVLSRAALAPKQGIAVVTVGPHRMTVSYGDGGVRLLVGPNNEPAVDPVATRETEEDELPALNPSERVPGWRDTGRWRRIGGLVLALGLWVSTSGEVAAQVPDVGVPAQTAPVPAPATVPDPQAADASVAGGPQVQAEPAPEGQELGPGVLWDLARAAGLRTSEDEERLLPGPVGAVVFIGFLTIIPTLLLLMTSFTRILVVLNLLRQALGTQTAPPTHLLIALSLLLSGFVMWPTLEETNRVALGPWTSGEIDEVQMLEAAAGPFRSFMLSQVREQDLAMFAEMQGSRPATVGDVPLPVLTSAFVTSELRRAFQIGFALFLPFVIIDVVVASVLMSMGMFMLPPVMVSLPFKLLLFVMVDGWSLMLGGLVRSFVV